MASMKKHSSSEDSANQQEPDEHVNDEATKKQSPVAKLKAVWAKAGIPPAFILIAFKGALPSVIALAAYENSKWAETYTTLGYLAAIMAHLSMAIQPRAKFMQAMMLSIVFICLGSAMALLQIQCIVASRSPAPASDRIGSSGSTESVVFDSSANTVSACFLFLWVFLANYVKSSRPQLTLPMIQFSIFVIVASVYGPSFPNMAAGESFVRRLLITFLTGFAIGTGVSLLVVPTTSRTVVNKQIGGLLGLFKGILKAHGAYMLAVSESTQASKADGSAEKAAKSRATAAAQLKGTTTAAGEIFGKIRLDLSFARKEAAFGKLGPHHYTEIFEHLREVLQPVMGLATFLNMIETLQEHREYAEQVPGSAETIEAIRQLEREEWLDVFSVSRDAYGEYRKALFAGIDHITYKLEFAKMPKSKTKDAEAVNDSPSPGDDDFAKHLEIQLDKFQKSRNEVIQHWCDQKEIDLSGRFWGDQGKPLSYQDTRTARRKTNQHQMYMILYINFLTYSAGRAILAFARWADARVADGTMTKTRFINPGWRRIKKLLQDGLAEGHDETWSAEVNGGSNIFLGDGLKQQKDPEHLPPANLYERLTDKVRAIPAFFNSEGAKFGFRAAVATMAIAIVAFLHDSRNFFLEQRGLWAMIMTAISMDPHAGQSIFGFLARIAGTFVAASCSIGIWYMCDQNHPAIIVIYYIYAAMWFIGLLKFPQYAVICIISSVTAILCLGYELQVADIGIRLATANGQEYYPIYLLASYRLVAVIAGLTVAFIFTFFPYPITTHGALRKDVGNCLYSLANYYSCVHTTLDARLHLGPKIHEQPKDGPIARLDQARHKVFGKNLLMLSRLREYHQFTRFEPTFGGKFPRETYGKLIDSIRNVFTYLALVIYSSQAFIRDPEGLSQEEIDEETEWVRAFREFAADRKVTSHSTTSQLCLLSSAIRNSQPLPPYLAAARQFDMTEQLSEADPGLLSVKHFQHPCYAAFAVGEVASAFIAAEMTKITGLVKDLVGEVDFSFHVVKTNDDGSSVASTLWEKESDRSSGKEKMKIR